MNIQNIIFDWSGTLCDDLITTYQASMLIFKKLGKTPLSLKEYRDEFTLPYMIFWNKYFPNLTKEEQDKLSNEMLLKVNAPKLYPGVKKVIQNLDSDNIEMIIISSQHYDKLITECVDYGISKYFRQVNGSVYDKTKMIRDCLAQNNFNPEKTMFVGDMTHDIDAGKKAGVITVGLSWGYQHKDRLVAFKPDYLISDINELEGLLR